MENLTVRDFLAANAPTEPQAWFSPVMGVEEPDVNKMNFEAWRLAKDQYDDEFDKQRYVQWPYAWADAVLAKMPKGGES